MIGRKQKWKSICRCFQKMTACERCWPSPGNDSQVIVDIGGREFLVALSFFTSPICSRPWSQEKIDELHRRCCRRSVRGMDAIDKRKSSEGRLVKRSLCK